MSHTIHVKPLNTNNISDITESPSQLLPKRKKRVIDLKIALHIGKLLVKRNKNPMTILKELFYLLYIKKLLSHDKAPEKMIYAAGRYSSNVYLPAWPSRAFDEFIHNILNIRGQYSERKYLPTIIFSITNQCPLNCVHCFEGDSLNKKQDPTLKELKAMLSQFQDAKVAQIYFSGGEPLTRYDELLELVATASGNAECWLFTSGLGLTLNKAKRLRQAGLQGVFISLDHLTEDSHDTFRGFQGSYQWVLEAAQNCGKANLMLCLTLCATKDFVSKENLEQYAFIAKKLGAGFIQIIEPQKTGRYAGKDITLNQAQLNILESFYLSMNFDAQHSDMPSVIYPSYVQRKTNCLGGGGGYAYTSANGDIYPCPFCRSKGGNILKDDLNTILKKMDSFNCRNFSGFNSKD